MAAIPQVRLAAHWAVLALTVTALVSACGSSGGNSGTNLGNGLAGSSPATTGTGGRLGVVAGENFWGNIAAQIGGDQIAVTSIITDPNDDPHQYETDVNDAAAVASASVVIENGVGYDDFMSRLLSAGARKNVTVLNAAKIVGASSDANPHLWYSPDYVAAVAKAIEQTLARELPGSAGELHARLDTFLSGEQQVVQVIAEIRARHAEAPVAYTERVPGYLLQAAGLKVVTPASFSRALEDGEDPSPLDNAEFEKLITGRHTTVLLYNSQVVDSMTDHLKSLARSHGVPVVGVSETIPAGQKDFQTWQLNQAKALLAALDG